MKTKLYSVITLLTIFALVPLPQSFAQAVLDQPSIRLVYFLPSDRPARPERITALQELIKDTQAFFADEMERHGYDRKTFRVETDRDGEPTVHRFNGRFNEQYYYQRLTDFKVWEEFFQQVNDFQHVYLIAIDLSYEVLNEGESCGLGGVIFSPSNADASFLFGSAAVRHRDITPGEEVLGGSAIMPASGHCFYDTRGFLHPLRLITHELAHAFGLEHDFSDPDSAVGGRGFRFSECDTEWLSVSRFFNSKPVSENASGDIQLISPPTYSAQSITLRFEITDTDGLHQAQLLVPEDGSWGPWKLIGCQELDGQTQQVEFLSSELTSAPERVMLQFMDDLGNITWATFLVDIASLLPPPKVVSIPDPNLKQAIRSQLGLASGDTLTDRAMKKLGSLNVDDRKITNIAGLEYATQLRELLMGRNQIKSYDRLAELPNLTTLYLWTNNISDLSVLPLLPKLELLDLNWNHIRDVSRLAGFTNLTTLMLRGNKISDVSPLTGLVNLEVLHLKGNPIQDISVLASLTKLRDVDIDIHQQSVPATGTWLAVEQPAGLSPENLAIKPGAFAIFVHNNQRSVSQQADFNTYRLRSVLGDADFPNLADFFQNGGRIELVSHPSLNPLPRNTRESQFADVIISEIMWGLDSSDPGKQYIELYNTSAHTYTFTNGDLMFRFSKASEEPLPSEIFAPPFNTNARGKVIDKVSNKAWKVPGQSGNISQNRPLISMYRAIDYTTGNTPEGTLASSWRASNGRVNLLPPSYGTPGAAHLPPRPVVQVGASERPPMYWINVKSGTLHRLVGAEVENLVPNVRNATGLAMDVAGGKLYWTERTSDSTGRIRRANLDGRNVRLVKNLTSLPHGIALDAANGKIYVTNAWGKVQRLDVDGSNFQPNLITDLERPSGLALDVSGGKVYWAETTGRIRRANLDGSNVEDVATGLGPPISIAIFDNTAYWTEKIDGNSGEIRFVNLQGNVVTRNSFTPGFPIGIAVDAVENKLYWTTSRGQIGRQNLDGSNFQPNFVTGLSAPGPLALRVETPMDVETPVVATTDAVVSISPSPVISPAVGERLTLNLKITAGEAVAGYQFIVRFDPTALRYVESGNGEYLPTGAFFVQPVVNRDRVELAATALAGVSNGDGTLATLTFEVMAVKASTLTLSEPLFADDQGNTFLPRVEGGEITEPPKLKGDVNGDGVVNIQDLVLVASSFGETGENSADINADGVVNIADLVLVAGNLGTGLGAPSLDPGALGVFTAADVREWLSQAHQLNSVSPTDQRGVSVLEQLLAVLTPKETTLLPNYPNPFNPETWIPYQLATSGDVKITIYDARGIVVRRLELGYRQAGYYTNRSRAAYWDGCNGLGEHVASGLYFYHLEAEGVSLLRKMVTLK